MSFGAVIISYEPSKNLLELAGRLSQAGRVVIVDNSESNPELLHHDPPIENVKLLRLGRNTGIAFALNVGMHWLIEQGCEAVFTFDQDSSIGADYVSQMGLLFNQERAKNARLAILAPNFFDVNSKTYATFSLLAGRTLTNFKLGNTVTVIRESSFAITSGACIAADAYRSNGDYINEYFIDHVDSEYCLRLCQNGWTILVTNAVTIQHAIGRREVHRLLGMEFKPNNHAPLRRYFITRNGIITQRLYANGQPAFRRLNLLRQVHEVVCVLLYEQHKGPKMAAIARGVLDGLLYKVDVLEKIYLAARKGSRLW